MVKVYPTYFQMFLTNMDGMIHRVQNDTIENQNEINLKVYSLKIRALLLFESSVRVFTSL